MARKKKVGFDTMAFSTDFLSDGDVVNVQRNIGASGVVILLSIYLQAFKRQGYFFPVNALTLGIICGETFSTLDQINSTIEKMLDLGVFHRGMYEKYDILTSAKLQEKYISQAKSAKRTVDIAPEHSLVGTNNGTSDGKDISDDQLKELSRMIVQNWNMLHGDDKWESTRVPESLITLPEFLDLLRTIIEKYDGTDNICTWIDIERNAFVEHPHLGLGQIVGHEPTFRMLYNMGEPLEFIPGVYSPPSGFIHPALKQEARMRRSGYSEEEIQEVTAELLAQRPTVPAPAEYVPPTVQNTPSEEIKKEIEETPQEEIQDTLEDDIPIESYEDMESNVVATYQEPTSTPQVVSVYITNDAPESVVTDDPLADMTDYNDTEEITEEVVEEKEEEEPDKAPIQEPVHPRKSFFAGRHDSIVLDGEEVVDPAEKIRKEAEEQEVQAIQEAVEETDEEPVAAFVEENDPDLSPVLLRILQRFNRKYEEWGDSCQFTPADEALSREQTALRYFREYLTITPWAMEPDFWEELLEANRFYLSRNPDLPVMNPNWFFDPNIPFADTIPSDEATRLSWRQKYFKRYFTFVTRPEMCPESTMRELGPEFMEMRKREREIREQAEKQKDSQPTVTPAVDETPRDYPEGATPEQKQRIDAYRSDLSIPRGDLTWLEDREVHPELYKAPDKPYGDRTAPLPWAKKNPPKWEELRKTDFCHPLSHGSTIRMAEQP